MASPKDKMKEQTDELQKLQKYVDDLKIKVDDRREKLQEQRVKEQTAFWIGKTVIPYLEGMAERYDEPLEDGIKRLINESKNPLKNHRNDALTNLRNFFSTPETRILGTLAQRLVAKQPDENINKWSEWMLENVIAEYYINIYEAIMETEGGKEWFTGFVSDLAKMFKRITA